MLRFFIIALLSITSVYAAIDTYEFKDKDKELRFHKLSADMRCNRLETKDLLNAGS
jgi:cytochrome c-type biogenesis protein CcmH/NrfF